MKAESRQIPQNLAARIKFGNCLTIIDRTTGLMAAIPLPAPNFIDTCMACFMQSLV